MSLGLKIRDAQLADLPTIVDFQLAMARETEDFALDRQTLESGVQAVFDDSRWGRYFVAEESGRVIASTLIQSEWSDWRNGEVWWIHSVYVHPSHRRKGAFGAIYAHIKKLAEARSDIRGLRLYVEKKNLAAQSTYESLGMHKDHYHLYEWMKDF